MTIPYLELYKEADGKVRILNRPWWRFIIPGRLLICEGFQIPRGYGIAYWDVICDDTVCYPLGINVIVAVLRKLHRFVKMPRFFITDQRDEWLLQAQLKAKELGRTVGYQSGYDRGLALGHMDGYLAGREAFEQHLNEPDEVDLYDQD